ncbi:ABC transporter substrate-binding protein [Salinibacterium hongtaonis]|uniref:Leucine-binding protein domain-containing protein n=1 Tax=Homoserinimonas hongtaonis TaxID=2079791 RepID=A0A2U1T0M3_9MICO|nr:ABC transporter substrate-binding protein [Salinibacterium hongtaonis]PWB97420.1 hypothetical protein DF220_05955 [Salinibacterium hongtaonis]
MRRITGCDHAEQGARRPATAARLAALTIAAVLALSGCAAEPTEPTTSKAPAPSAPASSGDGVLTIGTLFSIGGSSADIAAAQIAGVELAVREINEAGGVLGEPVRVFHRTSGNADESVVEASFAELVTKEVDVVIGLTSSTLVDRIQPLADESGIALFSQATATGSAVDDTFASRVLSMDPAIRTTDFAAEAYDATILAALAATVADDDGGATIAYAAAGLMAEGGADRIECTSFGECRHVLADRADIHFSGISGALPPFS